MHEYLTLFVFIVGAILSEYIQLISDRGSFLDSIWGRSKCDSCKKEIPWYALIPLIGRFLSEGKCPNCGKRVAWKYFWFELLFIVGWAAVLLIWIAQIMSSAIAVAIVLSLYCVTALLMYEDAKRFSVPISWLITWAVAFGITWFALGAGPLFIVDTLLMVVVLGLSLLVVSLQKPGGLKSLTTLFGAADLVVLLEFALFLGFQKTTGVLLFSLISVLVFLVWQKRLKIGQQVPLLTAMLPWGLIALFL